MHLLNIQLNGQETPLQGVHNIHELMTHLGYAGKRIAVERNGEIVPKSQHAVTALHEDDQIEIVVAVGGG